MQNEDLLDFKIAKEARHFAYLVHSAIWWSSLELK